MPCPVRKLVLCCKCPSSCCNTFCGKVVCNLQWHTHDCMISYAVSSDWIINKLKAISHTVQKYLFSLVATISKSNSYLETLRLQDSTVWLLYKCTLQSPSAYLQPLPTQERPSLKLHLAGKSEHSDIQSWDIYSHSVFLKGYLFFSKSMKNVSLYKHNNFYSATTEQTDQVTQ